MRNECGFCGRDIDISGEAIYNVWYGETGQRYCSEDCMNEANDAPKED